VAQEVRMFYRWLLMQAILPVVMVMMLAACGGSQQPQVQQPTAPAVQQPMYRNQL
jgi:hypothetical protein